jgi:hypothetical protein
LDRKQKETRNEVYFATGTEGTVYKLSQKTKYNGRERVATRRWTSCDWLLVQYRPVDTFSFSCVNNLLIKFLVQRKGLDGLKEAQPESIGEAWR